MLELDESSEFPSSQLSPRKIDDRKRAIGLMSNLLRNATRSIPKRINPPATMPQDTTIPPTIGARAYTNAKERSNTTILATPTNNTATTRNVKINVSLLTRSSWKLFRRSSPYFLRLEMSLAMMSTLWSLENTRQNFIQMRH